MIDVALEAVCRIVWECLCCLFRVLVWIWDNFEYIQAGFAGLIFVVSWPFGVSTPRQFRKDSPLRLERRPDGKRRLVEDFSVTIGEGEDAIPITVPAGFKTDFSSIPPGLGWTMHWTRVDVAGVVHDWLYANARTGRTNRTELPSETDRLWKLDTDRIWFDIARSGERRAQRWQAGAGWLALVIFGFFTWRKYRMNTPLHLMPEDWREAQPEEGEGD